MVEACAAALEPPVLADRGLGQRAAGADGEERERAQRLVLRRSGRVEDRPRDHPLGEVVGGAGTTGGPRRRARRGPTAPRAPSSPASSSTCRCRRRRPRSRASRAGLPRGSAPAPARREPRASSSAVSWKRQCPLPSMLRRQCGQSSMGRRQASCAQYSKMRPRAQQLLQLRLGVRADAARQREPVRAVDRRDRVELHRAEPADRSLDLACRRAAEARRVPLRRHGEPPDRGQADGGGRHRLLPSR